MRLGRIANENVPLTLKYLFMIFLIYFDGFSADAVAWRKMDTNPVYLIENPKLNQVFHIGKLYESGLRCDGGQEQTLFARQQVVTLFQNLDNFMAADKKTACLVQSSPGMGKSCSSWAWACKKGMNEGKHVLWIRLRKIGNYPCVSMFEKTCSACSLEPDLINRVLEDSDADVILVDGLQADLLSNKSNPLEKIFSETKRHRKIIFISSMASGLKAENFGQSQLVFQFLELLPWQFNEFRDACKCSEFFKTVREKFDCESDDFKDEILDAKFLLAGASARWMFEYPVQEIEEEIQNLVDSIPDPRSFLDFHLVMQTVRDDGTRAEFFVSKRAMFAVMDKFQGLDIRWAYELASKHQNRSDLGWVIEFDFIEKLFQAARDTNSVTLKKVDNEPVELKVSMAEYFETDTPLWSSGKWIVPRSSSEAGFDAVGLCEIEGEKVLSFIHVTCSYKHDLRLDALYLFAQRIIAVNQVQDSAFCLYGINIIFVLPKFTDQQTLEIPELNTPAGDGHLLHFRVGNSSKTWSKGTEKDNILFYGFEIPIKNISRAREASKLKVDTYKLLKRKNNIFFALVVLTHARF